MVSADGIRPERKVGGGPPAEAAKEAAAPGGASMDSSMVRYISRFPVRGGTGSRRFGIERLHNRREARVFSGRARRGPQRERAGGVETRDCGAAANLDVKLRRQVLKWASLLKGFQHLAPGWAGRRTGAASVEAAGMRWLQRICVPISSTRGGDEAGEWAKCRRSPV